jgi:integrase
MIDTDVYARWLEPAYRPRTVRELVRGANRLLRGDTLPPSGLNGFAARKLLDFMAETGASDETAKPAIDRTLAGVDASKKGLRGKRTRKKKVERTSFSDDDWSAFVTAIVADEKDPARVLDVMAATGLRVGDVLRLTRAQLERGMAEHRGEVEVKGGKAFSIPFDQTTGAWARLLNAWKGQGGKTVAEWLARDAKDPMHAAYQKIRRRAHALAAEVFEARGEPVYTHRFRRTVAVQALRVTKDIHAVQRLLGHASYNTTLRYTEEARREDVAELHSEVAARFHPLARSVSHDDDPR